MLQSGQAISCPLRCLPAEVVANESMRRLVSENFPPPRRRALKPSSSHPASPEGAEDFGQSVPRSRSSSARSRGLVTDTLDLDNLPWHIYERSPTSERYMRLRFCQH